MVRKGGVPTKARHERAPMIRATPEYLLASDQDIVAPLAPDKMVPDLSGRRCPKRSAERLAPLTNPKLFRRGAMKGRA